MYKKLSVATLIAVSALLLSTASFFAYAYVSQIHSGSLAHSMPHSSETGLVSKPQAETKSSEVSPVTPQKDLGFTVNVPVLMYHHVGYLPEDADGTRKDLTVTPEVFEQEVEWLKNHGYTAVSLEQIYQAVSSNQQLPPKTIAFTFDDGYQDVFDYALPTLQKYGYTGAFGIITGYVGDPGYATWDTIKKAQEAGFEIVSHTENHFDGSSSKFSDDYIYADLVHSKQDLTAHLGSASNILIYPYGHYTAAYITQAQKAGFVMAFTVAFGSKIGDKVLMEEPRYRVHGAWDLKRFSEMFTSKPKVVAPKPQTAPTL